MPVIIEREQFIRIARSYVARLLQGICEGDAWLAASPQPNVVRVVAKLSPADFDAIKFSDLYISVQKVVKRLGERHRDPATGAPHMAEFKLYDPYFESLVFERAEGVAGSGTSDSSLSGNADHTSSGDSERLVSTTSDLILAAPSSEGRDDRDAQAARIADSPRSRTSAERGRHARRRLGRQRTPR